MAIKDTVFPKKLYHFSILVIFLIFYTIFEVWTIIEYPQTKNIGFSWVNIIKYKLFETKYYSYLATFTTLMLISQYLNPFRSYYYNRLVFGSTQFAKYNDIKKMNFFGKSTEGSILGKFDNFIFKRYIVTQELLAQVYIGASGCGKTAGRIIPELLTNETDSIFILDIKGEITALTSHYRRKFSNVVILNPITQYTNRWNPFNTKNLDPISPVKSVQEIADLMFKSGGDGKDDFFVGNASRMFSNIALALIMTKDEEEEVTFTKIKRVITPPADEGTIEDVLLKLLFKLENKKSWLEKDIEENQNNLSGYQYLIEKENSNNEVKNNKIEEFKNQIELTNIYIDGKINEIKQIVETATNLQDIINKTKSEKSFQDIVSTFGEKIKFVEDVNVANTLEGSDITFADFRKLKKPTTFYFIVQQQDLGRLSALIKIFTTLLTNYLTSVPKLKTERNVSILLDEFPQLGKMEKIIKLLSVARSYGVKTTIIGQNIAQFKQIYNESAINEIMSSSSVTIFSKPKDNETATHITKTLGHTTTLTNKEAPADSILKIKTETGRLEKLPVLSEEAQKKLSEKQIIIINKKFQDRPILATQAFYFLDKKMINKMKINKKQEYNFEEIIEIEQNMKEGKKFKKVYHPRENFKKNTPILQKVNIQEQEDTSEEDEYYLEEETRPLTSKELEVFKKNNPKSKDDKSKTDTQELLEQELNNDDTKQNLNITPDTNKDTNKDINTNIDENLKKISAKTSTKISKNISFNISDYLDNENQLLEKWYEKNWYYKFTTLIKKYNKQNTNEERKLLKFSYKIQIEIFNEMIKDKYFKKEMNNLLTKI